MSYDAIEGAIQTLLQGLTGTFATSAQVTRADWRVFDAGLSPFGVLYPGPVSEGEDWAAGAQEHIWTVNCELTVRFLNDGTSVQTLVQVRDAVIAQLQRYPSLNGLTGIQGLGRMQGGEIIELYDKDGNGPSFIQTTLTWQVTEASQVTGGEIT